jgi:ABC-type multidrug transport system fused ATPase/permease subunit
MADKQHKKDIIPFTKKMTAVGRHVKRYRSQLVLISALGIVSALANGVVPLLVGKFLDGLIHPTNVTVLGRTLPLFTVLLAVWVATQVIANTTDWLIGKINRQLGTNIQANFVVDAYSHMLTLPVSFFKDRKSGELSQLVSRASWMLDTVVSGVMVGLAPQFLSIIVGLAIAFWLKPLLALVLVGGIVLYVITLVLFILPVAGLQNVAHKRWSETFGNVHDAYANLQTVKNAGAEQYERDRAHEGYFGKDGAANLWNKLELSWNNINVFQRVLIVGTQLTIFAISISFILKGSMTIGELIAFNSYAAMVFGPFVSLGGQWQSVQNGLTATAQVEEIFLAEPERYDVPGAVLLNDFKGDVAFKNVEFAYGPEQPPVLKGISFEADSGTVVALVGETGAGKSTTAELLSGYYLPTEGSVTVDGHDIRNVSLRELRRHIAIVPQEVVLFNSNIIDNIRYGRPDASDEDVIEAARRARADVFIEKFPDGYKQLVGERGIKLSVGQKQRIAIARAILRNPRILILDEPTSALDAETEAYITKSLEELMQGRTTFIIAHRLSTVRQADMILVLKNGLIAERGSHKQLMAIEGGEYRRLYELHTGLHE